LTVQTGPFEGAWGRSHVPALPNTWGIGCGGPPAYTGPPTERDGTPRDPRAVLDSRIESPVGTFNPASGRRRQLTFCSLPSAAKRWAARQHPCVQWGARRASMCPHLKTRKTPAAAKTGSERVPKGLPAINGHEPGRLRVLGVVLMSLRRRTRGGSDTGGRRPTLGRKQREMGRPGTPANPQSDRLSTRKQARFGFANPGCTGVLWVDS